MALAAAAAARRCGLRKVPSVSGIRRSGDVPSGSSPQAPSKEEVELFVKNVASFVQRAQLSLPQEEFGNLLKDLSSSMSTLALNEGIMYPTELANLVATFVPVAGTYMPHNSKVVVVDLVQRMNQYDRNSKLRNLLLVAALATFGGIAVCWPSVANNLEFEDKRLSGLIASTEKNVAAQEAKFTPLEKKVSRLEYKLGAQEKAILTLQNALQSPSATAAEESAAWSKVYYASAAGIGVALACMGICVWANK